MRTLLPPARAPHARRRLPAAPTRPHAPSRPTQVPPSARATYNFAVLLRITFRSGSYQCGGSLIAADVVLTAAHCLSEDPQAYLYPNDTAVHGVWAFVGWQDMAHYNASAPGVVPPAERGAQLLRGARWAWHERFRDRAAVINPHDVALVWLAAPVLGVPPVQLDFPPGLDVSGAAPQGGGEVSALALGWGITLGLRPDDDVAMGRIASKLQRVRLPVAAGALCDAQAAANGNSYDGSRQTCTATDGNVDTCYVR